MEAPPPALDAALVRRLLAAQFPRWADLPLAPVEPGGWDHRTFRLGDAMAVRLPSADAYAGQPGKEHRWLPRLAPRLPVPVPEPLALGEPGAGFPRPWSIHRWIEGTTLEAAPVADALPLAADMGAFLAALHRAPTEGGPPPGPHNFLRGGPPSSCDAEVRESLRILGSAAAGAAPVWEAALEAAWDGKPVWVHGDFAPGNLLVEGGRLRAVLDFGLLGVGDPACDLAPAWTFLPPPAAAVFLGAVGADAGARARGRGWVLWKALITLAALGGADVRRAGEARRALDRVIADSR